MDDAGVDRDRDGGKRGANKQSQQRDGTGGSPVM